MKRSVLKAVSALFALLTVILAAVPAAYGFEMVAGTNPPSESYKSSKYYSHLTSVPKTGDGRYDVLAVALSQLGYTESNAKDEYSGLTDGKDNYTEYNYNMGSFGSGYGGKDYPWCASFVSFCLLQSGCTTQSRISDWCRKNEGDPDHIWREVSCSKWAAQLRRCGNFRNSLAYDGNYRPLSGDLIFFTNNGTLESHIGLVLWANSERVYTVEGNTSPQTGLDTNGGGVYVKSYKLTSTYIKGYGVLPYKEADLPHTIDRTGAKPSAGLYISSEELTVLCGDESISLPIYTLFKVTNVSGDGSLNISADIDGEEIRGSVAVSAGSYYQLSAEAEEIYDDTAEDTSEATEDTAEVTTEETTADTTVDTTFETTEETTAETNEETTVETAVETTETLTEKVTDTQSDTESDSVSEEYTSIATTSVSPTDAPPAPPPSSCGSVIGTSALPLLSLCMLGAITLRKTKD